MEKRWVVGPEQTRQRLDLFLVAAGAGPSRASLQRAISQGLVRVNSRPARARQMLAPGDEILLDMVDPVASALTPEAIPLDVVYEDADLIVINKPRGLVVHPAAGNPGGTLVNALLAHCRDLSGIGGVMRPGIVHRLDKDTTGLMVAAKNDRAHLALAAQLRERSISRIYVALVRGCFQTPSGRIELPIGRHPVHRKRMAVTLGGREARTDLVVLENLKDCSLLRLSLGTGRTHQIRVHLAAVGHPVLADPVYGRPDEDLGLRGQALHAAKLSFKHPVTGATISLTAEPPPDFLTALRTLRGRAGLPLEKDIDL